MQTIFNCCHGVFETHAGRWICSTHVSDTGTPVDEEIIGDEGPSSKPHVQRAQTSEEQAKLVAARNTKRGPPRPMGGPGGPEDDKETAKLRLQRLIRDFAHDAVGPGLEVEAQTQAVSSDSGGFVPSFPALLRMDHRLSRLELWPPSTQGGILQGSTATLAVPLQQVASIAKGGFFLLEQEVEEHSTEGRESSVLTVMQRSGPELRLLFDSTISRDRAYTCLRIFQMSVDQSLESQSREAESDLTGYESNS
mmetsp:Transcript_42600/g.92820  ORF Transcript_42600/g.92820 Transcript_42600/m.92820 type:complete len:251 (+) Transcript_42600:182-934(+)